MARDLYSYLHLPMVAGIVLFALGMKTTAHVDDVLEIIPAVGLAGGLALYFAAHVAVRLRVFGGWGHGRPAATIVLLALIPVATQIPALAALALVAAVCAALIAYEAFRYPYARSWTRSRRGAFSMEEASRIAATRGRKPGYLSASTDPDTPAASRCCESALSGWDTALPYPAVRERSRTRVSPAVGLP